MTGPEVVYWRSINGSHWKLIELHPESELAEYLAEHPDEIYEAGGGFQYRADKTVKP